MRAHLSSLVAALLTLLTVTGPAAAYPKTDAEYIRDLTSKDVELRRYAASYLATKPRNAESLYPNFVLLLDDPDQHVRDIAAGAVAKIGGEDGFDPLLKAFHNGRLTYHSAASSLLRYKDRAFPFMVESLESKKDGERFAALRFLARSSDPRAVEPLAGKLKSDPAMRLQVMISIHELGLLAVPRLIELSGDPDDEVSSAAVYALRKIPEPTAGEAVELYAERKLPAQIEALSKVPPVDPQHALGMIARIGPSAGSATPFLQELWEKKMIGQQSFGALRAALQNIGTKEAAMLLAKIPIIDEAPASRLKQKSKGPVTPSTLSPSPASAAK